MTWPCRRQSRAVEPALALREAASIRRLSAAAPYLREPHSLLGSGSGTTGPEPQALIRRDYRGTRWIDDPRGDGGRRAFRPLRHGGRATLSSPSKRALTIPVLNQHEDAGNDVAEQERAHAETGVLGPVASAFMDLNRHRDKSGSCEEPNPAGCENQKAQDHPVDDCGRHIHAAGGGTLEGLWRVTIVDRQSRNTGRRWPGRLFAGLLTLSVQ